jgi:hypothetical protein
MQAAFGNKPIWKHDREGDRYIGTWYGCDCYVADDSLGLGGSTLIVRDGDNPDAYGSSPCIGYNTYAADMRLGGLGLGRTRGQYAIESSCDGWIKAELCALAFLGREYLDNRKGD